tara:strand:- start:244 stop:993 length:750 start_codon:yes stop_codon:yes gene_type:complete
MFLLGDIGNTDVKIFLVNDSFKIIKKVTFKTNLLSINYLSSKLNFLTKKKLRYDRIIFSSVVPKAFSIINIFFKKKVGIKKILEVKKINLKKLINIKVNYSEVGSDRIANAIGIIDKNKNYIVIDFGTATTFDVVVKNNYLGGVIAPGVNLSLKGLSSRASLIPNIHLSKVSNVIGTNTAKAVKSGFYWGYLGLIDNIINLIMKQTRKSYKIILTGGLAYLFKRRIKYKSEIIKDLTVYGLIKIVKSIK